MAKINKLQKEIHMVQIEVHKLQLQVNTKWEVVAMANQAKEKIYDQLVERGLVELREALEKAKADSKGGILSKSKTISMLWMWHISESH